MTTSAPAAVGSEQGSRPLKSRASRLLIIGCGALVRELQGVAALNPSLSIRIECLPAKLHNRPERIAGAVQARIRAAKARAAAEGASQTILVGYMDCGTGGELDKVCRAEGVKRLPGVHCYELYAGASEFASLHDVEPGTFYLTDFLVRHFDRLIMDGLGITKHPQLLEMYFGNYTQVVHLAQTENPTLTQAAQNAAAKLGLRCERIFTGISELNRHVVALAGAA